MSLVATLPNELTVDDLPREFNELFFNQLANDIINRRKTITNITFNPNGSLFSAKIRFQGELFRRSFSTNNRSKGRALWLAVDIIRQTLRPNLQTLIGTVERLLPSMPINPSTQLTAPRQLTPPRQITPPRQLTLEPVELTVDELKNYNPRVFTLIADSIIKGDQKFKIKNISYKPESKRFAARVIIKGTLFVKYSTLASTGGDIGLALWNAVELLRGILGSVSQKKARGKKNVKKK